MKTEGGVVQQAGARHKEAMRDEREAKDEARRGLHLSTIAGEPRTPGP